MNTENTPGQVELKQYGAPVKIWDIPLRLFHWSLVVLIAAAWWTAERRQLDWHRRAGYCILTLVLFRLLWGWLGSTTARFANFVRRPAEVMRYMRSDLLSRRGWSHPGHNPLGGWSVVTMLGAMLIQTALGLFAVDIDGIESGPLAYLVSFDTGRAIAAMHEMVFNILLALLALHVVAVLFYRFYKQDKLIVAMISGYRYWRSDSTPELHFRSPIRAIFLLLSCAALVVILVKGIGR